MQIYFFYYNSESFFDIDSVNTDIQGGRYCINICFIDVLTKNNLYTSSTTNKLWFIMYLEIKATMSSQRVGSLLNVFFEELFH